MPKLKRDQSSSRRKHTNSKLGCSNCKRKKIRCDEKLPQCGNCSRGKKEICSYLSLNQSELNRIRLTHSLRNSQNKLLDQDYRLPTSSSSSTPLPIDSGNQLTDTIEFKHELTRLPIDIPRIKYSSLKFDNLMVDDFAEFEDTLMIPEECELDVLPNGFIQPISFPRLDHNLGITPKAQRLVSDLTHQLEQGKMTLLDHFNEYFTIGAQKFIRYDLAFDSFYLIGLDAIEKMFFHRGQSCSNRLRNFILNKSSKTILNQILDRLKLELKKCELEWPNQPLNIIDKNTQALGYVCFLFHFYSHLELEKYYEMSLILASVFEIYIEESIKRQRSTPTIHKYLLRHLQYNIASIRIPSYHPEFFHEIKSNLNDLQYLYNSNHGQTIFQETLFLDKYQNIIHKYNCLMKFLDNDLLPIILIQRDEDYVSTYPETTIFNIVKMWHRIFPGSAITYNPEPDWNDSYDSRFIQDLTTTLYMYYISVSAALEAVFPTCKYLFTVSFMTPTTDFFQNKLIMTPWKNNQLYHYFPVPNKVYEKLQNHNYYSMRIYAFFRRRYLIYQHYITWTKAYGSDIKQDRLKSRVILNSIEVQVKRFNTTLIRPEHYPTMKIENTQAVSDSYFTRVDENIEKELYTRNIEKLNFFQETSLQYDYETMLLLRDYRRLEEDFVPKENIVDIHDLIEYYEDRNLILGNSFPSN